MRHQDIPPRRPHHIVQRLSRNNTIMTRQSITARNMAERREQKIIQTANNGINTVYDIHVIDYWMPFRQSQNFKNVFSVNSIKHTGDCTYTGTKLG